MRAYILAAAALILALAFGLLWWNERTKERPMMPPGFIEERITSTQFIPVVDKFVKIYSICPKSLLKGSYIMGWTATANYVVDLSQITVREGDRLEIELPPLGLLNGGDNMIAEADHFWFPRPFAAGLRRHYGKERERAVQIARAHGLARIQQDKGLKRLAERQLRSIIAGIYAEEGQKIGDIVITLGDFEEEIELPSKPSLCKTQPLSGEILPVAGEETPSKEASAEEAVDLSDAEWRAWIESTSPVVDVSEVRE